MKKLIALVIVTTVLGLFALPTMAAEYTATASVQITVEEYCKFTIPPGSLIMTVNDIWDLGTDTHNGLHQAETSFTVQSNGPCNIVVTADYTSGQVSAQGTVGEAYPTAYIGANPANPGIAYGAAIYIDGGASDTWTPGDANSHVNVDAGISTGKLKINSYIDQGRNPATDNLASPGVYTGTLTLTLTSGSI